MRRACMYLARASARITDGGGPKSAEKFPSSREGGTPAEEHKIPCARRSALVCAKVSATLLLLALEIDMLGNHVEGREM